MDELRRLGSVKARSLSSQLGVSTVTIRADLDQLEREGRLRRIRGGALPIGPDRLELPLEESSRVHAREKARIGQRAASLVRDGQTIIMDVGGTITELAKALPKQLRNIVVLTSALNIALLLESHPGITVVVTGGTLRPLQHSLVNPYGTLLISEINADLAFLGCNGVHPVKGFTNTNLQEAEVKRATLTAARETVVLADHSKLMRIATAHIAPLSAAKLLISGKEASPDSLAEIHESGLEIALA